MYIAVTGCAGYDGSRLILGDSTLKARLLGRYTEGFLSGLGSGTDPGLIGLYTVRKEQGLAESAADGGVLAALWRLLKGNRTGGSYSLRAIPIMQQTVEICEMFDLDPYRLHAPSCRVWLGDWEFMRSLMEQSLSAGIPCSVIGETSAGPAINRLDTETLSQLRRPTEDELKRSGIYKGLRPQHGEE